MFVFSVLLLRIFHQCLHSAYVHSTLAYPGSLTHVYISSQYYIFYHSKYSFLPLIIFCKTYKRFGETRAALETDLWLPHWLNKKKFLLQVLKITPMFKSFSNFKWEVEKRDGFCKWGAKGIVAWESILPTMVPYLDVHGLRGFGNK